MKYRSQIRNNSIAAIRAADAAWLKAYDAKDIESAAAYCDEDASMLMPNSPIVTGKAAITKLLAGHLAPDAPKVSWRANKAGVALAGDLGYTSGAYKMSFKPASGKTISDKGKYLIVWKKQSNGEWKVLFDISNSDLPRT